MGVEIEYWQECGLAACDPLGLGQGLARGTMAIAARVVGVSLEATVRTLCGMPAERSCATDHEVVHDLVVGRRQEMSGAVRLAIEA